MHEHPPSDSSGIDLYRHLLDGDIRASSDIALAYYDRLYGWLVRNNPNLDPHYYQMAVDDALIDLFQRPQAYDPSRASLYTYLKVGAKNRLLNALRSERRHSLRRAPIAAVELFPPAVNHGQSDSGDPADIVEQREHEKTQLAQVLPRPSMERMPEAVTAGLTAIELGVLELHIRHERKTAVFAQVMGISDLPPAEQKRLVKRLRDKLDKRLKRAGVQI